MAIVFTIAPIEQIQSQSVFDRFSKRYLKKNRVKKVGKRLSRNSKTLLEDMAIEPGYEIIGFEPSWMIEKGAFEDHYFNLLTTLVIGEYDINPTNGKIRNRESLRIHLDKKVRDKIAKKEFNIIEKADFHNSKLNFLLQLTYYGDYGTEARQRSYMKSLLTNTDVHQSLKDSLNSYFLEINNDYNITNDRSGILVDFQIENNYFNEDFIDFIKYLRTELGEQHLIYVKIPAKVRKDALIPLSILQSLDPYVDRYIVQGYGFEKYTSTYSPMTIIDKTSSYSLDGTLRNYNLPGYEETVKEKFIFELPYYGVIFKRDDYGRYALKEGSPYITIDDFNKDVKGRSGALKYKNNNTMAYYLEGDSLAYLVEDSISLVTKYNYIIDSLGMNGFALNALGYYSRPNNSRRGENWAGIADNFGEEREKLGWVIAMYLTAFLPLGFIYSIFKYWEVRNTLAKFGNYWNRFRMFFVFFILVFLVCSGILPRQILMIIGIIIMAAFFVYIMIKKVIMRSKKYVNIVK